MFQRSNHRPCTRLITRPRLEILEDRLALATRTWDGGALSNNWSNASNWVGNIAPVAGDDLVFPAGNFDKTADNDYTPGTHFRSISVGGGYTLRGNRIFLGEGGVTDNSGTSNAIKNDLDLGNVAARSFQTGSGSTLFLDGVISGSSGLTKLGTGNLSLRSNNTYTGITSINAGGLFIEKDEALGQGVAGTNIFTGATLVVNDTGLGAVRVDERLFVQNNGTIRGINDVVMRGDITALGTINLRHDGSVLEEMKMVGDLTGQGGIHIQSGTGRVTFDDDGIKNYQGVTTIAGLLTLKSDSQALPGSVTIISGGILRNEDSNQLSSNAIVNIQGTGRWELNGYVETVEALNMAGGSLRTISNSLLGELLDNVEIFLGTIGGLTVNNDISLTSFSSTVPARLEKAYLFSNLPVPTLTVNDGPAFNDAIFESAWLKHANSVKDGLGTLLDQSFTDTFYAVTVAQGSLRVSELRRGTDYVVNSGASFASDSRVNSLLVEEGGRVRTHLTGTTGQLTVDEDLTLEPGAIVEAVFNGSNFDSFDVEGTVDVDGAILEATLGSGAAVGQTYKLINNSASDAILGAFFLPPATAPFLTASPAGQRLAFNYQGGLQNNDLVLTLQNTPPKAPDLALNTTEINEGGTVTATGSLVDPDARDKLRLFINWGDGSRQEVHRPGRDLFSFTHRYRQDGVYTARFEWLDQTGQGNSREFTITVNNVAPAFKLRTFRTFSSGLLLASGWLSDAGDDRYTATLDFGDGTSRSKTLNRRDYFAIAHKYKNPGNYTLTLTLRDAQGAESVFQREVVII